MTKQLTHLHLEAGPAGWVKAVWRREAGQDNEVFVRFQPPRETGQRWLIVGLHASKKSQPVPWLDSNLLEDVPRHRIELALVALDVVRESLLEWIDDDLSSDLDSAIRDRYRNAPRFTLERPARNRIDENFLRGVAMAYRRAVAEGLPPLKTMADDSGIPQGTIARWVAKARSPEFKLLPPAEAPGKVSL